MPSNLKVALTGDSVATRRIPPYADDAFQELRRILGDSDVVFGNVEVVLSDEKGGPSPFFNLSGEPAIANDLREFGINLASFAHNHSLNFGERGMFGTLRVLREAGMVVAGAGADLADARTPRYLETRAGRVALIACSSAFVPGEQASHRRPDLPGRAGLNPQRFDTTYVIDETSMRALRTIAEETGLEARRQRQLWIGFRRPPRRAELYDFLGSNFAVGSNFAEVTEPNASDADEHISWIKEARRSSDIVIVSMHTHENGPTEDQPATFMTTFARSCIDAGADVFVGHGPHLLRGLEVYNGRPVFYSLGNFIFHYEYVNHLPGENFAGSTDKNPSDFFRRLHKDDTEGFPADRSYWESVLPVLSVEAGRLSTMRLYPLALGYRSRMPDRGTPRVAKGELANEILQHFAKLSSPFGTQLRIESGTASVEVG